MCSDLNAVKGGSHLVAARAKALRWDALGTNKGSTDQCDWHGVSKGKKGKHKCRAVSRGHHTAKMKA